MELGVRDWMIIVGALLIVAVLLDGYRRVRNERRGNIKVSLNKQFLNSAVVEKEENLSELPSGRARAVGRELSDEADYTDFDDNHEATDLHLDQEVPMLMESINAEPEQYYPEEPIASLACEENTDNQVEEPIIEPQPQPEIEPLQQESVAQDTYYQESTTSPETTKQSTAHPVKAEEMVVINVVAKDEFFKGPDLLHILLACDVRYGDMNIFHRYEKANGTGAVQFSVANSVEPGDFNLDEIDNFSTPGVCFFMSVPGPEDPIEAFDCLVETAQCLVKNLNGELRDESRSVMTAQTLEHCRQRLFEFERRQLTQHA